MSETVGGSPRKHVAVVHFHGIGQQKHYEEVAELVEQLDRLVRVRHATGDKERFPIGRIDKIKTRFEQRRLSDWTQDEKDGQLYVDVEYGREADAPPPIRFYEAYWAPATNSATLMGVLAWLPKQLLNPWMALRAPWRDYERSRRSSLIGMGLDRNTTKLLLRHYQGFCSDNPAEGHARTFEDFKNYLKRKEAQNILLTAAEQWKRRSFRNDLVSALGIAEILLAIGCATSLLALGSWWFLGIAVDFARTHGVVGVERNIQALSALMISLITILGLRSFLVDYLGDVQQYVTRHEVEPYWQRRRAVLDTALRLVTHVLEDELCDRVVITAHSLGSAVAMDTMLELGQRAVARNRADPLKTPIKKIQHFLTYGSPIDKIQTFFLSSRSRTRIYDRLIDDLQGDLHNAPFSKTGKQPYVHWINYWDVGDIISGSLESMTPADVGKQRVTNIQLATHMLPDPAGSHASYFRNQRVLEDLFDVIFLNRFSFIREEGDVGRPGPLVYPKPGSGNRAQHILNLLLWLWPLVLLASTVEVFANHPDRLTIALCVLTLMLVGGVLAHRVGWDTRERLK